MTSKYTCGTVIALFELLGMMHRADVAPSLSAACCSGKTMKQRHCCRPARGVPLSCVAAGLAKNSLIATLFLVGGNGLGDSIDTARCFRRNLACSAAIQPCVHVAASVRQFRGALVTPRFTRIQSSSSEVGADVCFANRSFEPSLFWTVCNQLYFFRTGDLFLLVDGPASVATRDSMLRIGAKHLIDHVSRYNDTRAF